MTVNVQQPLLLTAREAAARLSISERTLLREARAGRIPSVRVRTRRLFSVESLKQWIDANETKAL